MRDIKDYLEQTNTVLLTKDAFEYLKERASVPDKVKAEYDPSADLISREETLTAFADYVGSGMSMNDFDALWNIVAKLPSVNPTKTGHCKDCKWWKDSDGTYCRVVHAESKCPINRKEVYEGNGYCYMFEPQERSE